MKMNRILFLVMILVFVVLLSPVTTIYANENVALQIEMTKEKQNYSADENINYEIKLSNTSQNTAKDIKVTTTIPDELEVSSEEAKKENNKLVWEIDSLEGLGQKSFSFSAKLTEDAPPQDPNVDNDEDRDEDDSLGTPPNKNNDSDSDLQPPKTGDNTSFTVYFLILFLSIVSLIIALRVLKKKRTTTTVTLLLIVAFIMSSFSVAEAEEKESTFEKTHRITIADKTYEIKTTVEAVFEEEDLSLSGQWVMDEETNTLGWKLSWNEIGKSNTYNIYKGSTEDEANFERVESEVEGSSFTDKDSNFLSETYYMVTVAGQEDIKSNQVLADATFDTDHDGLADAAESMFGTDVQKADSDEDGLPDGYEVSILESDPLTLDSNGNGIPDGDDDYDSDGLSNYEEYEMGTNPLLSDSDFDGLTDAEEVNVYNTDPLQEDSDQDGMLDGNEIKYGTDPLNPDTDGNGIKDGDELYEVVTEVNESDADQNVQPAITMQLAGKNVESVSIAKISETDPFLNTNIPGYIGAAYDFNSENEFDEATMTFTYDESVVSDEFRPEIFYYNEEEQRLDRLENQTHDPENNTVTVKVEHFSSYILLNAEEWDQLWETEVIPPNIDDDGKLKNIDIVFSIDSSGSMGWEDPDDIRKTASQAFVDKLREEDRAAVVDFDSYANLLIELTTDKAAVKYAIDMIDSSGGTNLYAGVTEAVDEIVRNGNEEHLKYIVFLTDGDGTWNDSAIDYANDNDVVIYTIGLGSGVRDDLLERIAQSTGGKYFFADNADQLDEIFEETAGDTIDRLKDTDSDRIPDYIEKTGLRLGNGVYIEAKKPADSESPGLDYEKADSDGDGLDDGEEVNIFVSRNDEGKVYFTYNSDPTKLDTDSDGLDDKEESELGTNAKREDTDGDGILDKKEVEIGTDPLVFGAKYVDGTEVEPGDIIVVKDVSWDFIGHAAIVTDDYRVVDIYPYGERGEDVKVRLVDQFFGKYSYSNLKVVRYKNSSTANDAAKWASFHYVYGDGSQALWEMESKYFPVGSKLNKYGDGYCSLIVWWAYKHGGGVDVTGFVNAMFIVHPYDFLEADDLKVITQTGDDEVW